MTNPTLGPRQSMDDEQDVGDKASLTKQTAGGQTDGRDGKTDGCCNFPG